MQIMLVMLYISMGLLVALIVFLVYCNSKHFSNNRKKEKEYMAYVEKSLEDYFFTDPETGQKFTLEEAEKGLDLSPNNTIRSDDEIVRHFFDEHHREIAFIKNDLLKKRYTAIADFEHKHPFYLYGKNAYSYTKAVFVKNNNHYCLLVSAKIPFQSDVFFEDKLILVYHLKQSAGHSLVWKTDVHSALNQNTSWQNSSVKTGAFSILHLQKVAVHAFDGAIDKLNDANEEIVLRIANVFNDFTHYEAEVLDDFVFIKDTRIASRNGVEELTKLDKEITLRLYDFLKTHS